MRHSCFQSRFLRTSVLRLAPVVLMLASGSLAPAQTLNLDQTAAPAPGEGINSAALVNTLQKEISDLSKPGVPGSALRTLIRSVSIDLIKAGVAQGSSGSEHVVFGRTLALRREAIDRWAADHDVPLSVLMLMREGSSAGVPADRESMEVWTRDSLGPLAVFAWADESIGWPIDPSRVVVRVPTESLPDTAMHTQFSPEVRSAFARVAERLAAAEAFAVTREATFRLRDDIAAAASLAGPQKPRWMSDATLAAWRSELVACVTSLIPSTGSAAYTPIQAAARLRVMRLTSELAAQLQALEPASAGRATLAALDQAISGPDYRTDPLIADRLLATIDALSLVRPTPADDKSLLRQLRPAARALEPAARNSAAQLLEDLPRLVKRPDALSDPGVLASINSARRRRDDQKLVRRLSDLCADTPISAPPAEPAAPPATPATPSQEQAPDTRAPRTLEPTLDPRLKNIGARLLTLGQDLTRNDRRDLAIGELRTLADEIENFRAVPGEDEAAFAAGAASKAAASVSRVRAWSTATNQRTADVLSSLAKARADWLAGWAAAKGAPAPENAAPLNAFRDVFAVLRDAAPAIDEDSPMNAWPGFELSRPARATLAAPLVPVCSAMTDRLLSGDYDGASKSAARVRAENAAALLVGRLERMAGDESLAESRDAALGAISQLVVGRPDAESAWLMSGLPDIRTDIASVCRYAEELVPPCDKPDRYRAFINRRAELVLSTLDARLE